jgi:hypothetical protein
MNAQQKLKYLILVRHLEMGFYDPEYKLEDLTAESIDEIFEENEDDLGDAKEEIRCAGHETDIPSDWSRHYECESRGAQLPDGSWVGWNYWFGGGKHGEPAAMPWIETAYDIECVGERTIIVREFAKK